MKNRFAAGALAGIIAGMTMAMAMMAYMYLTGRSVWTNPDLIAAMWMGKRCRQRLVFDSDARRFSDA